MRTLVWLRRDLRTQDNPALSAACRRSREGVVALYFVCPKQWKLHSDSPRKIRFWLRGLRELSQVLGEKNIPLLIKTCETYSDIPSAILKITQNHNISEVYFNKEYEINEKIRDRKVIQTLTQNQVGYQAFTDRVIIEPGELLTQNHSPFSVFTPFKNSWLKTVNASWRPPLKAPRAQAKIHLPSDPIPETCSQFKFENLREELWPAGEQEAQKRLQLFVKNKSLHYQSDRDIPSLLGTSFLSPYLAAGFLSPRQAIAQILKFKPNIFEEMDTGLSTWLSQIIWREFFTHVLELVPRVSKNRPFQLKTENLKWRTAGKDLSGWQRGETGYPIVDAAQRQLLQTGWMHNRLRMVSAMFLTKHLLIDWREGEKHFMSQLIDGDLAANNGGWQWSASTGTDTAPYFRIFNPSCQSSKFDPQAKFILRFCPELEGLPLKQIHQPELISPEELKKRSYPPRIVDHKTARARAIQAFKDLK